MLDIELADPDSIPLNMRPASLAPAPDTASASASVSVSVSENGRDSTEKVKEKVTEVREYIGSFVNGEVVPAGYKTPLKNSPTLTLYQILSDTLSVLFSLQLSYSLYSLFS